MKTCSAITALALLICFVHHQASAQPVIQAVKTTNANSQLRFDITGGSGPFAVERANLVTDPWCSLGAVNQRSNVLAGVDGRHAFFRVRDLTNAPPTRFTVSLSGAAEHPPNGSSGDGFGTLEINGDTLTFDIAYRNLSIGSQAAHIHAPIDTSTNAGVTINFASFMVNGFGTTTGRIAGSVPINPNQKAWIMSGQSYVNIHTTNFTGGEIRGQVVPTTFRVVMSSAGERPNPSVSSAYGLGAFTLIGNQLSYHIAYQGLNSSATASHIHGPAGMGGTATVMYDLLPVGGFGRSGTLAGRTNLTPAQIAALVDGKAYANIHTTNFPGGEIRGQVLPYLGELPFSAELTGAAERPTPVTTSASGFTACTLQSNVLSFVLMYRNLSGPATLAHIHGPSPASGFTGVLFDLTNYHRGTYSTQGVFVGAVTLSPSQISNLLSGDLYMNIHTAANGGGEVRGQLCPTIFPIALNGAKVPPSGIATPGTGFGYVGLVGKQFSIGMHYRDLTSAANNAHLHGPGTTNQSVGTLINLNTANYTAGGFGISGFLIGSQAATDATVAHIVDGLTYVNIHTGNNPGGEIRSQVEP
jgi:hypothetical protein